jgi:methyl-accepting chemotaxis protein
MAGFSTNSIGGRFRLAFGGLFLALAMVSAVSLYQTTQLNAASNDLSDNRLPSVISLSRLAEATMRLREAEGAEILATDTEHAASAAQSRSAALADITSGWKDYQRLIDPGEERQRLAPAIDAAWQDYSAQDAQLETLVRAGDKVNAASFYTAKTWPYFAKLRQSVNEDLQYNFRQANDSGKAADAAFAQAVWRSA